MRRKLFGTKKRAVLAVLTLVVLISSSVALAAWIAGGNGQGNAKGKLKNAETVTFTIVSGTIPAGSEFGPGETGRVYLDVGNPNGQLFVSAIAKSGPATITGQAGTCAIDTYLTLGSQTNVPAENWAPGDTVYPGDNNGGFVYVNLDAAAPSGCAGGTVTFPVSITAIP